MRLSNKGQCIPNRYIEIAIVDELCHISKLAKIFADKETSDTSPELHFYRSIVNKHAQHTFSNVEIALRIYLTLMVSN